MGVYVQNCFPDPTSQAYNKFSKNTGGHTKKGGKTTAFANLKAESALPILHLTDVLLGE